MEDNFPKVVKGRSTGTGKAPAQRAQVLAMYAKGTSKSTIASTLGMSRNTITAIIENSGIDQTWEARAKLIVPDAFDAVHNQIKGKQDGNLAMRYLERTVFAESTNHRGIDTKVNVAIGLLSSNPVSTGISAGPSTPSPTQAAAKDPPVDCELQSHGQFLQNLDSKPPAINELENVIDVGPDGNE